jgi:hypothetical protein
LGVFYSVWKHSIYLDDSVTFMAPSDT